MKQNVTLIVCVATALALLAIGCCELVAWSRRDHDQVAIMFSSLALGMVLWMLAWWLLTWARKIWRDVAGRRKAVTDDR
jgi:uncharacterized membrane protein